MRWRLFVLTLCCSQPLLGVLGFGTTVSIAVSFCPATPTLASSSAPIPTATPYVLQVQEPGNAKRAAPEYIAAGGTVSTNPTLAIIFHFSPIAQLIGNGSLVSTSNGVGSQNFSPNASSGAVQTTFSINPNGTLDWANDAFVGRHALFCSFNSIAQVVFNQQLPIGCNQVLLEVVPLSQIVPISTSSTLTSKTASSMVSRTPSLPSRVSSTSTASFGSLATSTSAGTPTTTAQPNCFDGSDYDGSVNDGYLILCDTALSGSDLMSVDASNLAECIDECKSTTPEGGRNCVAVEFDILSVNGACTLKSSIGPVDRGNNPFAQAAILAAGPDAPSIVYSSGSVSSSAPIPTSTLTSSTGLMTSIASSVSLTQVQLASSSSTTVTASSNILSSSANNPSKTVSTLTSSTSASTRATTSSFSSTVSFSLTASSSVSPPSVSSVPSSVSIVTVSTSSSGYPVPTTSPLCPNYNHQVLNVNGDGYDYEIECSTSLQGVVLTSNSTTATSFSNCVRYCTLYNVALPYGCLGVNYIVSPAGVSPNCLLLGSISGTSYSAGNPAARLIYPGYPSPADPIFLTASTTLLSSTSSSQTSLAIISSSSSPLTSTTVPPTLTTTSSPQPTTPRTTSVASTSSATPFSQSHCPAPPSTTTTTIYNSATFSYLTYTECPSPTASPSGQCFYYDYSSDPSRSSSNYEIECATSFNGVAQQPLLVTDFHDCISWCAYANKLVANSCTALTYLYGQNVQGGSNNCFRYSSISCANRTNANLGVYDSARLLYASYPAINDYQNSFTC